MSCYQAGQWLPAHVDSRKFARPFAILSLASQAELVFEPLPKAVAEAERARDAGDDRVWAAQNGAEADGAGVDGARAGAGAEGMDVESPASGARMGSVRVTTPHHKTKLNRVL